VKASFPPRAAASRQPVNLARFLPQQRRHCSRSFGRSLRCFFAPRECLSGGGLPLLMRSSAWRVCLRRLGAAQGCGEAWRLRGHAVQVCVCMYVYMYVYVCVNHDDVWVHIYTHTFVTYMHYQNLHMAGKRRCFCTAERLIKIKTSMPRHTPRANTNANTSIANTRLCMRVPALSSARFD
jgi:hypothetical protein